MTKQYSYTALQSQNAVSAYFTSNQILPFGFAEQYAYNKARLFNIIKWQVLNP